MLYSGACRDLTPEQRAAKTRRPAWRVRVPDIAVSFRDGVCGPQTERLAETCGDFIVRRSDGVYAYQLAVVCDDALGSVTEVVRGCDLLGSTARQLWLFSVFSYPAPQYYHVPLLVAPDGRRLSKRERDLDMEALRARSLNGIPSADMGDALLRSIDSRASAIEERIVTLTWRRSARAVRRSSSSAGWRSWPACSRGRSRSAPQTSSPASHGSAFRAARS